MLRWNWFMDTSPLRESPAFRRLWLGTGISTFGGYMTTFAVTLQLYNLTHSSLAIGLAGLCSGIPTMAFGLLGGSIGDSMDRRKLVLAATSGQTAVSALFAAQAFIGVKLQWILYILLIAQSLFGAINAPARRTFLPRILPKHRIQAGAALNTAFTRFAEVAGPSLAGILASLWGFQVCYAIDTISFAAALYGVARLPAMPPEGGAIPSSLRSIGEGLRFVVTQPVLLGAFLADLNVTVLGAITPLLPALNAARFEGRPDTLGFLMAATGIGGLMSLIVSGPLRHLSREGRGILFACAFWSMSVMGVGLVKSLWLTLLLLAIAGAADTILVVLRSTLVQVSTPDSYRGRVSGMDYVVGTGAPRLGNVRAGFIGAILPPGVSVFVSGLSSLVATVILALSVPAFSAYTAQTAFEVEHESV
ncbi:MFS transporter [Alicyclobacillus hesperidum]|uniref:MFS transporter n=1 Tax=Alicyclobacillus hesperidum TaxID=89784 RepID=A0A1H2RIF5_9BACL|nr:MFS transporter [Alicyclobacillus hesperidum]GLV13610.1 MFS transporter [Alicyclobacillus hesperidum]SDW19095.1 Transmembrane secretion effector [Alicyclobacillus hesperidum]